MKKYFTILLVLISITALAVSSCATITRGSSSEVSFTSGGEGELDIKITDRNGMVVFEGSTPATVTLKKQAGIANPSIYTVEAMVPGTSAPAKIELRTLGDAAHFAWGAFLLGNFWNGDIGMYVDLATGALYKWQVPSVQGGDAKVSGTLEKKEGMLTITALDGVKMMDDDKEMMDDDKMMKDES